MPSSETQFKPGQSGNPKGRPRSHRYVRDIVPRNDYERIILALADKAGKGDAAAAREILSRIEPAVKVHEISVQEGLDRITAFLGRVMDLIPEQYHPQALALLEQAKDADAARPLH